MREGLYSRYAHNLFSFLFLFLSNRLLTILFVPMLRYSIPYDLFYYLPLPLPLSLSLYKYVQIHTNTYKYIAYIPHLHTYIYALTPTLSLTLKCTRIHSYICACL
ncbi:hypothetical protein F4703DRAFT_1145484 [Phycomyces blakesleeanus]